MLINFVKSLYRAPEVGDGGIAEIPRDATQHTPILYPYYVCVCVCVCVFFLLFSRPGVSRRPARGHARGVPTRPNACHQCVPTLLACQLRRNFSQHIFVRPHGPSFPLAHAHFYPYTLKKAIFLIKTTT